jgi:hypothetical protein
VEGRLGSDWGLTVAGYSFGKKLVEDPDNLEILLSASIECIGTSNLQRPLFAVCLAVSESGFRPSGHHNDLPMTQTLTPSCSARYAVRRPVGPPERVSMLMSKRPFAMFGLTTNDRQVNVDDFLLRD